MTETALVANVYHPHIVEVHARGEFDGRLWTAMDYVEGSSAAQLMAERFPAVSPAGEVLAIITAVASALDHAHHRGLLHRDVKPANILLTSPAAGEQRILLADFGIAPRGGTVGYAAPEQLTGAELDGRADQYALAATAFHLLTGAPPVASIRPGSATSVRSWRASTVCSPAGLRKNPLTGSTVVATSPMRPTNRQACRPAIAVPRPSLPPTTRSPNEPEMRGRGMRSRTARARPTLPLRPSPRWPIPESPRRPRRKSGESRRYGWRPRRWSCSSRWSPSAS